MKRLIAAIFLLTAPAFAAEVNFVYFPTGPCPLPGAFYCATYDQTAGVVVTLSSMPGTSASSYTVTVAFTNTITGNSGTMKTTTATTQYGLGMLGWPSSDTPNIQVTAITVSASLPAMTISKHVPNPQVGVTY